MKHWISLVNVAEVDQYIEIARFAEELGFYGITVADHLVIPTKTETPYPYTPDGKTWWPDDTPWPDPFVAIAAMSAATSSLHLASNIYLAGLRDPFTAAKAISTAAVLSNNRVICGVSSGWLKEEFDVLNIDFKSRGKRLDEMLKVLRLLWSGKNVNFSGNFFNFEDVLMSPAPSQAIPIWSGGMSKPALHRAAENDGWLSVPMFKDPLIKTINNLHSLREQKGNVHSNFDICFTLLEASTADTLSELENVGANNMMSLPWLSTPWGRAPWLKEGEDERLLSVKKLSMERFANKIF